MTATNYLTAPLLAMLVFPWLESTGKNMRHVKVCFGRAVNDAALADLIAAAYGDIRQRLAAARF